MALAGSGWGWQVQRDRTVVRPIVQHVFFLTAGTFFGRITV
jgi:hypothetical protein